MIKEHSDAEKEKKKKEAKDMTKKQKAIKMALEDKDLEKYRIAEVDGVTEKIANFRVAPPAFFVDEGRIQRWACSSIEWPRNKLRLIVKKDTNRPPHPVIDGAKPCIIKKLPG